MEAYKRDSSSYPSQEELDAFYQQILKEDKEKEKKEKLGIVEEE